MTEAYDRIRAALARPCPTCDSRDTERTGGNVFTGVDSVCHSCGAEWTWKPTPEESKKRAEFYERLRAEYVRRHNRRYEPRA